MDPLKNILPDLFDLVFQHFDNEEILELSMLSRTWYKTLGQSQVAMSKVWLDVGDRFDEPSRDDVKAFRISDRNYENFTISEMENGLQILLFPRKKWKRAKIDIQSFTSYREYVNLLEIINESVIDLEVFDMEVDNAGSFSKLIKFDKLTRLKISSVSLEALMPFVQPLPNLKKLIVEEIRNAEESCGMLWQFLCYQNNLTHLNIASNVFVQFFENPPNCKFKLKFLCVEQNFDPIENLNIVKNFQEFLISQDELKWVVLSDWTDEITFNKVFSLPNIERVSIEYFDAESEKIELKSNIENCSKTLSRIDFECEDLNITWIKSILDNFNCIKILYFYHVSADLLKVLVNRKNLECVKYCSIFDDHEEILKSQNMQMRLEEEKYFDYRNII
jgi:IMP cyclohydrolase